jgi:hypothetical protein
MTVEMIGTPFKLVISKMHQGSNNKATHSQIKINTATSPMAKQAMLLFKNGCG